MRTSLTSLRAGVKSVPHIQPAALSAAGTRTSRLDALYGCVMVGRARYLSIAVTAFEFAPSPAQIRNASGVVSRTLPFHRAVELAFDVLTVLRATSGEGAR